MGSLIRSGRANVATQGTCDLADALAYHHSARQNRYAPPGVRYFSLDPNNFPSASTTKRTATMELQYSVTGRTPFRTRILAWLLADTRFDIKNRGAIEDAVAAAVVARMPKPPIPPTPSLNERRADRTLDAAALVLACERRFIEDDELLEMCRQWIAAVEADYGPLANYRGAVAGSTKAVLGEIAKLELRLAEAKVAKMEANVAANLKSANAQIKAGLATADTTIAGVKARIRELRKTVKAAK